MTTPIWQAGTLYQPGALVIPSTTAPVETGAIDNPDFTGKTSTGWTLGPGFVVSANPGYPGGSTGAIGIITGVGDSYNNAAYPVAPGQLINANCYVITGGSSSNSGGVLVAWYDASMAHLSNTLGPPIKSNGGWTFTTVPAVAPANAAYAAIGCAGSISSGFATFSHFTWDYTYAAPADALTYEAVQAAAATSGSTEPIWPTIAGQTVVDGGVTWEAVTFSEIDWIASAIMTSGTTEPTWPLIPGQAVLDNNITWVATTNNITDTNCPNTETVCIGQQKIFAVDNDIVAFCATDNPLDWTTQGDAGFLPTGLQNYGQNPAAVLGLYRGNLIIMNSGGYQMWQIDPDPANMAFLDGEPVGSDFSKSAYPAVNDLMFLTPIGVRSIGVNGATGNLQAGNTGDQIDSLIVPAIAGLASGQEPRAIFWPRRGQYWLSFGTEVFVLTVYSVDDAQATIYNSTTQNWGRYVFPEAITDMALLNNDLYLRTTSGKVWVMDEDALLDDVDSGTGVVFTGTVQWPFLSNGSLGGEKNLEAFDIILDGECTVSIGWDQTDPANANNTFTTPFQITGDTLPGQPYPLPIRAKSFSMLLGFNYNQAWEWEAANLYFFDQKGTN
jgi:hypothetical protein